MRPATWPQAFAAIVAKVKATQAGRIGALAGDIADMIGQPLQFKGKGAQGGGARRNADPGEAFEERQRSKISLQMMRRWIWLVPS